MAKIGRIQEVAVADLIPYENNPRLNDGAVPYVTESIRQCGYVAPIIVDEDNVILAGHTRRLALIDMSVEKCNVLVVEGLDEEQKKKFRILDNKTGELATWDDVLLAQELDGIDFDGFDFGQPVKAEDFEEAVIKKTKVCPCCGKEFEV